jgi:RND family efflux transporter MFP subunit
MKQLFTLAAALVLVACNRPAPPPAPPRPALVITAGASTTPAPTVLVGEVRSRYESTVGFRIAGKIVERKVDVGSTVKKGQVLARLDAADAGLSAQAAQAEVRAAEADHALAAAELERQRQLHVRKFVSAAALDVHEARFKSSQARLQQARAQAAVAGNQSQYTALVADRNGIVTEIRAEPGQVVEAGEQVARITVPETMEVAVAVPESRMDGVIVDAPAEVRLWAAQSKVYQGKVREIAPAADSATRTFQVRVAIPGADGAMRLGMTAGVRFYHQEHAGLLLPTTAVTQWQGQPAVWVVDAASHQVQPRAVQVGAYREDGVPVTQGLREGEQVVATGLHVLTPGMAVRPVETTSNR